MIIIKQVKYGDEAWDNVRKMANIDTPTFSIHQVTKGDSPHSYSFHNIRII